MASFKMMSSSNSRNSDLSRRNSSSASSSPSIRSSHHLRDHQRTSFNYDGTVHDYTFASESKPLSLDLAIDIDRNSVNGRRESVDDVWKEIVSVERKTIMKEEAHEEEEEEAVMTLEDFLAKSAAMEEANLDSDEIDVKIPLERLNNSDGCRFDYPTMQQKQQNQIQKGKRGRVMMIEEEEAMDKATAQRQKRMIKNRESAARSRERKQAYQVELETLAAKLEQENQQLLKEIEYETKERYHKLMEKLIPVVEKHKPSSSTSSSRSLSRSHSLEW